MSLRDIKDISELIKFKLDHGLDLDNSICVDFEKKTDTKIIFFQVVLILCMSFSN